MLLTSTLVNILVTSWWQSQFRSHNANVIKKVQKDRLLIWNLKDGWDPICKFLNVPVPDEPIPVVNKTTDKMFFDNLFQDKIGKNLPWKDYLGMMIPIFFCLITIYLVTPVLIAYFLYQKLFFWLRKNKILHQNKIIYDKMDFFITKKSIYNIWLMPCLLSFSN